MSAKIFIADHYVEFDELDANPYTGASVKMGEI